MSDEAPPAGIDTPRSPEFSKFGTKGLEAYLAANRSKFTEDALRTAAVASGWEVSTVDAALGRVREAERSAPTKARARRIVRLLYVGGFLALSIGMILNVAAGAAIGIPILGATLGTAYFFGSVWMRSRRVGGGETLRTFVVLLIVPVTLWAALTGLCLATGLPTNGRLL